MAACNLRNFSQNESRMQFRRDGARGTARCRELAAIDSALLTYVRGRWLKVARVVGEAIDAGEFSMRTAALLDLHVRRLIGLIEAGVLEVKGNPRRIRWSEVRLTPEV
jgi:hypothetical protein